ncbi:signal peptidase I [Bacillus lacus]|uniref:Signal peptidase I n=1 Tax=Metabacillus lacus TaxID=1983721 RepID=A0A7X2LYQ6_9BACI|nr:signal peptidase I [Metabacillus lacus]MRX72606.1 signal peptidase I [Metabacillus lacus]
MNKILKVLSGLITFCLSVLLILSLYLMVSSKVTGGQPVIFGHELMLVLSGSMEPGISTGSVVGIERTSEKTQFKKGDVITFYSPIKENTIITHRIVDVQGSGEFTEYFTKGDNNESVDPRPVSAQRVIGKFSGLHVPYAGHILNFLQSKSGIALSLILPGLILIIYNIISLVRLLGSMENSKVKQTDHVA